MNKNMKYKAFLLLGILFLFGSVFFAFYGESRGNGDSGPDELVEVAVKDLPENTMYVTQGRLEYGEGDMLLLVPSIGVQAKIGDSTEWDMLKERPGLYEFSQLPAKGNVNVSIAGHRDIYDMVFYDLDKMEDGDYLYLLYKGRIYRYLFHERFITHSTDWSVIAPQGFSCLTLTTCDPIGTSLNRLIVTGKLQDIQPYDEQYPFIGNGGSIP